mmetsp:Transcript_18577/g.60775  ORF Transcript_18577/g.60775 Transcript_18577/m.60775 type:complete len:266 (-) Transcript_18577:74-871(-)
MSQGGLNLDAFVSQIGEFAGVLGHAEGTECQDWNSEAVDRAFGWADYVQGSAALLADDCEAAAVDRWLATQQAQHWPSSQASASTAAAAAPASRLLTVGALSGRDGAGGARGLLLRTLALNPTAPNAVTQAALQRALGAPPPGREEAEAAEAQSVLRAKESKAGLRTATSAEYATSPATSSPTARSPRESARRSGLRLPLATSAASATSRGTGSSSASCAGTTTPRPRCRRSRRAPAAAEEAAVAAMAAGREAANMRRDRCASRR